MNQTNPSRSRYKQDALFRHWLPVLGRLARGGARFPEEVWHEAQVAVGRISREETGLRETELEYIYTDLCAKYAGEADFTSAVMAVLFTCLADTAPKGHPEDNPHAAACVVLQGMMGDDERYNSLLNAFFGRTRTPRGEKVVLPLTDYVADGGEEEEDGPDGIRPVSDADTVHHIVDEVIAAHDSDICKQSLVFLSRFNAKNGHVYQKEADRLVAEIYRLNDERSQPCRVDVSGTYIENNQGPVNGDVHEQKLYLNGDGRRKSIGNK